MDHQQQGFFSNLKYDFPAGIVVFLVALPLCLGIALASGASEGLFPIFAGLIAGIVGGTIVAVISGSPLGVSGPAAGLAVIVLQAVQSLGYEAFLVAVVIGGVIQIVLGLLKAGIIGYYFPNSVIKGMLSGIGIVIFLKQIPHIFGVDSDPNGDFAFAQVDGLNTITEFLQIPANITPAAVIISLVGLAVLVLYEQPFMKKLSFTRIIQGPLVVVILGIILYNVLPYELADNHLVNIPPSSSIQEFFGNFTLPDFSAITQSEIWVTGVTLAIVASLESLLCVEATDKLDPQKRITPTNRELIAQGTGNMVSGLIGGLPVTQVIVRSSANIQSGGRTKAAAVIHGFLLLICVVAIPNVLNQIPYAALAAILLLVGYKLAKPAIFSQMWNAGFSQFLPYIVTILGIVFIDLLWGIGLGLVVAFVQILINNYSRAYHLDDTPSANPNDIRMTLSEDTTFLNKASILNTLQGIPEGAKITIDGSKALTIHPDILEIIKDFTETTAPQRDITVELISLQGTPAFRAANPMRQFTDTVKKL